MAGFPVLRVSVGFMGFFDRFRRWRVTPEPAGRQAAASSNRPLVEASQVEAPSASKGDLNSEILRCAERLRPTATAASDYLSVSIECPVLASAQVFTPLLEWAFFNPWGPTLCALH